MFNGLLHRVPGPREEAITARTNGFVLASTLPLFSTNLTRHNSQQEQLPIIDRPFQGPFDHNHVHPVVYHGLSYDRS